MCRNIIMILSDILYLEYSYFINCIGQFSLIDYIILIALMKL